MTKEGFETVMDEVSTIYRMDTLCIHDVMTMGIRGAIKGMRYPKNSEIMSDSIFIKQELVTLGEMDKALILRLCKAGEADRKMLRMIHFQASVKMPMSWWIQYATYKVATTENSRSRMHKFGTDELTLNDFYEPVKTTTLPFVLEQINKKIKEYKNAAPKDKKRKWRQALDSLPMTYLQERMIDVSYEALLKMLLTRATDKLDMEWGFFLSVVKEQCPLLREIYFSLKPTAVKQESDKQKEFDL